MTDFQKRNLIKAAALMTLTAAALVGCGKSEEPAKTDASAASSAASSAPGGAKA